MPHSLPPTVDPVAAARFSRAAPPLSPWLHEEVAERMAQRLEWIRREPRAWGDWDAVRGGVAGHRRVVQRYPAAVRWARPWRTAAEEQAARPLTQRGWRLWRPALRTGAWPQGQLDMVWANMVAHMAADPQALLADWHRSVAVDGFLMFSCLGPDTLREVRATYQAQGWPPPSHAFTDMHDWGDMLVQAGFAEPVMDMERLTLTYATPEQLLAELRELGVNLHVARFGALRGRQWHARLRDSLAQALQDGHGRLAVTFEIIYGHAFKPAPRGESNAVQQVPLADVRAALRQRQLPPAVPRSGPATMPG